VTRHFLLDPDTGSARPADNLTPHQIQAALAHGHKLYRTHILDEPPAQPAPPRRRRRTPHRR
jgi:hypothetical protein